MLGARSFRHRGNQAKFSSYWLSAIDACRRNPRALWKTVNNLLQPPSQSATDKLSADDFAKFFVDKAAKIRASTLQQPRQS